MANTDHKSARYVVFFYPLPPRDSSAQIPFAAPCSRIPFRDTHLLKNEGVTEGLRNDLLQVSSCANFSKNNKKKILIDVGPPVLWTLGFTSAARHCLLF